MTSQSDPTRPERLAELAAVDTVIHLSRGMAEKKIYPCVDPRTCRSRLLETKAVGDDHAVIAERARQALSLLLDPTLAETADQIILQRAQKLANFLPPLSLIFLTLLFCRVADPSAASPEVQDLLSLSVSVNIGFLALRYLVRVQACHQVYGFWDPLGISLRWPVALYINMAAVWRAWKTYLGESAFARRPIVWSKTAHEIPEDFMNAKR